MEKTATLNLRVNPTVKQEAESVLDQLGIPMSTAITMYLKQIALTGGIPFTPKLPAAPYSLDADRMDDSQLSALLGNRLNGALNNPGIPLEQARAELLA